MHRGRSTELDRSRSDFGVFLVSREGEELRKGIFLACMSDFGLSEIPVLQFVVQFPRKQSPAGTGRVVGGTGIVTGSTVVFLVMLGIYKYIYIYIYIYIFFTRKS